MTNLFIDKRYAESTHRLALGIEPRDALTGRATVAPVDARHERIPEPFERWRSWPRGESLTQALPPFTRHSSGRFVLLYTPGGTSLGGGDVITCRLDDGPRLGRGRPRRRFVPRRIQVQIQPKSAVVGAIDPSVPIDVRSIAITLFPGSGAPLDPRATAVRCRVLGPPNADGNPTLLRWCRVRVTSDVDGSEMGWGHGDDRGECVIVLGRLPSGSTNDDLAVKFTVGARVPPLDPDSVSVDRRAVDPLWDLPVEKLGVGPWAPDQLGPSGRRFLPEHQTIDAGTGQVPVGRTTSVEFAIN